MGLPSGGWVLLQPLASNREFNEEVTRAINAALFEILGEHALEVLYKHLKDHYDIGPDEIPYQLPTIYHSLEEMFGEVVIKAIGVDLAKKLYSQLGLKFDAHANYTFQDYIAEVEKLLLNPE